MIGLQLCVYNPLKPGFAGTNDSAEYQAFQKHFAVLSKGISLISDPGRFAMQLYSRGMISIDMMREAQLEILPVPTRTRKLLSAVEDQIIISPEPKFRDFLDILHSEPSLEHLARMLEETCSKLKLFVSQVSQQIKGHGMCISCYA